MGHGFVPPTVPFEVAGDTGAEALLDRILQDSMATSVGTFDVAVGASLGDLHI